jgi:hypothetical protein
LPEPAYLPLLNAIGNLLPESFYKKYGSNKMPNILVTAKKGGLENPDLDGDVKEILALSLTGKEDQQLLSVWFEDYRKF